ncbi:hypothetical protein ABZ816_15340 [Actinosynnema sp. NPDC047251]|uniref:Uncharacterized protein n=1 Tax=Saccharothrix espanaensis (strain ATCC 51144 / DSM 44229 / JCM 9112 / NBRC 15066 / NRRL 15764) TaxID=1179773 RepID=K0JUM4_SACES|nr:hypothetical protein [Saccharothrix espanaensis]CCH29606.1 hypothetical protein BN6_22860 [Saccharothrix espanaensis DSM 44229]
MSSVAQLTDNLAALDLVLPDDAVARLEAATAFRLGFPGEFIAECEPSSFVFGDTATLVEPR